MSRNKRSTGGVFTSGSQDMPNKDQPPPDKSERERRKDLTDEQIRDLELAGGVEGGMKAGSAGGPGEKDANCASPDDHRDDGANDNG